MDERIRRVYAPMTETGFYILLCLKEETHGYGIVKQTEELTNGEIKLSPGTLYGSLSKMEKDGLSMYHFKKCEPKDVIYQLDYNEDSVSQKEDYVRLFEDCGWEYLQN